MLFFTIFSVIGFLAGATAGLITDASFDLAIQSTAALATTRGFLLEATRMQRGPTPDGSGTLHGQEEQVVTPVQ